MNIIRLVQTATATEQDNPSKYHPNNPQKDQKHIAYATLVANGMSKSAAAKVLGYSTGSISNLDRAADKKSQIISIVSDRRIRTAHRVIDKLMNGKVFGDIESVRSSDALRAAEVVLDRAEPKAQDVKPPSLNYTVINMDIFKNDPVNPPIDVSAEVMSGNDTPEKVGLETSLKNKGNNDLQFDIMAITRRCDE